jgi:repressor LexA
MGPLRLASPTMPNPLSDLERQILDYLVEYLQANTYQPSVREIAERFGIRSTRTVTEHLGALAEKGYVERDPSRSRGVRILGVELSPTTVALPCFSGLPDTRGGAEMDAREGWLALDRRLVSEPGTVGVRATHDEWESLGVLRGDLLLIAPATAADLRSGDLVIVAPEGATESGEGSPELVRLEWGAPPSPAALAMLRRVTGRVTGLHRAFGGSPVLPLSPTAH